MSTNSYGLKNEHFDSGTSIFTIMIGKTVNEISGFECGSNGAEFIFTDGSKCLFYHEQDCCESVSIADVCGDVSDLIGSPILQAEEVSGECPDPENPDSFSWTFYKFATNKGSVTVRWLGESNGYYSEDVNFEFTPNNQ